MSMLLILVLFLLAGAGVLVAEALSRPTRQRRASLARARAYGDLLGSETISLEAPTASISSAVRERAAAIGLRLTPRATVEKISLKLVAAGLARRVSPMSYLASKTLLGAGGVFLGALLAISAGVSARAIIVVPMLGAAGFFLPDVYLTVRARSRREEIRVQLPDALDLLAVSVEAGVSFDGAVAKLTEYMDGPLIEEFQLTLGEMKIGESRPRALKHMGERVDVNELTVFTQAVIQSDELGSSIGQTLRVQAEDSRRRRQAAAEEKAMKLPVKMIFPTAFLIFPVMFIVVLGPAFIDLANFF